MESLIMFLRTTMIFVLQLLGALMVSYGLQLIWFPLSPIFNGAILLFVGHRLYLQLESEEVKK